MPESGGTNGQAQESPSPEGSPWVRDVFISYASQDAAVANSVVEALEQHSITCWIAPRDVIAGEFYADAIVHAIDASRVLVLILSQHASASPHILREVERASAKHHPVISLRIHQAPLPSGLEYFLNTSQWLDANNGEVTRALPKLIEAIRRAQQSGSARTATSTAALPPNKSSSPPHKAKSLITIISVLLIGAALALAVDKVWLSKHTEDAVKNAAPLSAPTMPIASAAPEKSVAVLPFVDMSEKKDQEYFSDGMSEELIDMLTKIPDLRVPARTSSFYFKGKPTNIAEIAKALGVAYVLEGSVRKSGKALRVTTQLIRVDTGYHLWSETYDRQLDDVFKVQDDIAREVVKALKISLVGESRPLSAGTGNVGAYSLYLQARAIYQHANGREDYANVVDYLRKALELDPQFSNAWVLLSVALSAQAEDGFVAANLVQGEARAASQQALKLNPRLPDAHIAAARILLVDDLDVRGAELQVRQAIELDPNNSWALSYVAVQASRMGEYDKAMEAIKKSITQDPVNPYRYQDLSGILYYGRKYPESLAAYRKMLDLNPGITGEDIRLFKAQVLLASGNPQAALEEIDGEKANITENSSSLATGTVLLRALAYDDLGRNAEADTQLAALKNDRSTDRSFDIALVYSNRGKIDEAFEWFDKAYRLRDNGLIYLRVYPLLKNVQSDRRFNQLLHKLGLQD